MLNQIVAVLSEEELGNIFAWEDIEKVKEEFKKKIKAPYVRASGSGLNNKEDYDIFLKISLQPKERWTYGFYENSPNTMFRLSFNGELKQVTKTRDFKTFRKSKVKSVEDAISKINKYLEQNKYEDIPESAGANKSMLKELGSVSSGTMATHTGMKRYDDIDGIRNAAYQILQRDGDREFTMKNLKDLLMAAKDEYLENKQRDREQD